MYSILVVFVGAFALTQAKLSTEFMDKVRAEVAQVGHSCIPEAKATGEDIAELVVHHYPPSTHAGKCLIFCFYKHYNYMKEDGSTDFEAGVKVFDPVKNEDAELHGHLVEIAHKCGDNPEIMSDPCETASAIATCFHLESEARHLRETYM